MYSISWFEMILQSQTAKGLIEPHWQAALQGCQRQWLATKGLRSDLLVDSRSSTVVRSVN